MKSNRLLFLLAICIVSVSACQKLDDETATDTQRGDLSGNNQLTFIQDANGTNYSIPCLRAAAKEIQANRGAMSKCAMTSERLSSSEGATERARMFHGGDRNFYGYSYWPPYYGWNNNLCTLVFGYCWDNNWYSTYFGYNQSYYSSYYNPNCGYYWGSGYYYDSSNYYYTSCARRWDVNVYYY